MIISIIVTITFTNTRGNSAAVIKHGPGTSTPCIVPAAFVFIFASTRTTTSNLLLSATRVPRRGTQQPCRSAGVTCKLNVYLVLTAGSSAAARATPTRSAPRQSHRTHNLILCLVLPIVSFLLYYNKLFRLPFLINLLIVLGSPLNFQMPSLLTPNPTHNFLDHIYPLLFFVLLRFIKVPVVFSHVFIVVLLIHFLLYFFSFRHVIVSPRLSVSAGISIMFNTISCKFEKSW